MGWTGTTATREQQLHIREGAPGLPEGLKQSAKKAFLFFFYRKHCNNLRKIPTYMYCNTCM